MAICSAIFWRSASSLDGLARVHFGARGGDELVDQVVGLDAEAFAAADFDVGFFLVLFGNARSQAPRRSAA